MSCTSCKKRTAQIIIWCWKQLQQQCYCFPCCCVSSSSNINDDDNIVTSQAPAQLPASPTVESKEDTSTDSGTEEEDTTEEDTSTDSGSEEKDTPKVRMYQPFINTADDTKKKEDFHVINMPAEQ
ncbi:hypothetical protein LCGC14_2908120 [marine sediment metagenome]|uniref:Uncharacterized protein n=2 Tax=root TaxID=1 RepID=A0A0F9AIL3_9ZZZZ|nr:MAG: hypothetical protein LCMAC202_04300 [Marseillevirus LCMAC202]